MPRRQQRGRGAAAAGGGADDVLMDSGKNSDYVEQLAFRYMRKCKVESSTDSESDNNNNEAFGTNVSIPTTTVDVKTMDFQKLKFRDPYDGDSEDSVQSDCSQCEQRVVSDVAPCPPAVDSVGMDCGSIFISDPQCDSWSLVPCSDPLEIVKTSGQGVDVSETSNKKVASVSCSSDLSMDSGMVTEDAAVASGRFFFHGPDSRVETLPSRLLPTSLTSEENSDLGVCETSLIKRKVAMRAEGENMRRKKPRVLEYMT